MELTAANILTLTRLFLAPLFVVFFVAGFKGLAFATFCVAGFTDLIDGTVARLLKQPSKSGALMDPIADKLLMQSCFVALTFVGVLPIWFFLIAFVRDMMIMCGIFYLERKKVSILYRPVLISKLATLLQLLVAVLGLWTWGWGKQLQIFNLILVLTALFIITSAVQYIQIGLRSLHKNDSRTQ